MTHEKRVSSRWIMKQFANWKSFFDGVNLPEECLQASRSSQHKNDIGSDEYSVSTIGLLTLLTRWATPLNGGRAAAAGADGVLCRLFGQLAGQLADLPDDGLQGAQQ